jgi:hypothetical protein
MAKPLANPAAIRNHTNFAGRSETNGALVLNRCALGLVSNDANAGDGSPTAPPPGEVISRLSPLGESAGTAAPGLISLLAGMA